MIVDQNNNDYILEFISKTSVLFKQGVHSIYENVLNNNASNNTYILKNFQMELTKIPTWNSVMIEKEFDRFVSASRCEWLDDLILAIFKSSAENIIGQYSTKSGDNKEIDIEVPKSNVFIHMCYIEIARKIWKKPQLFFTKLSKVELQTNDDEIETIIHNCIIQCVRSSMPLQHLIKSYVLGNKDNNKLINTDAPSSHTEIVAIEPSSHTEVVAVDYNEVIQYKEQGSSGTALIKEDDAVIEDEESVIEEDEEVIEEDVYIADEYVFNRTENSQRITDCIDAPVNITNTEMVDIYREDDKDCSNSDSDSESDSESESESEVAAYKHNNKHYETKEHIDSKNDALCSFVNDIERRTDDLKLNNSEPKQYIDDVNVSDYTNDVCDTTRTIISTDENPDTSNRRDIKVDNDEYTRSKSIRNEIRNTIKKVYIDEKKKRNKDKIQKILGINITDYSKLKKRPKSIRNQLLQDSSKYFN
jgi:hypothetical protein